MAIRRREQGYQRRVKFQSPLSAFPRGWPSAMFGVAALALSGWLEYVDVLAWRRVERPLGPGVDSAFPVALMLAVLAVMFTTFAVVGVMRGRKRDS